jgi:hypothetical protein
MARGAVFSLIIMYIINKYLPYFFIQDYSSSSLHAASSCTDLGETCSSNVPGITQFLVFVLASF